MKAIYIEFNYFTYCIHRNVHPRNSFRNNHMSDYCSDLHIDRGRSTSSLVFCTYTLKFKIRITELLGACSFLSLSKKETYLSMHPSFTFSCLVAISGRMGSKSLADFPELRTISLMQPTKDSIMYFTPCNRSSELSPVKNRNKKPIKMRKDFRLEVS